MPDALLVAVRLGRIDVSIPELERPPNGVHAPGPVPHLPDGSSALVADVRERESDRGVTVASTAGAVSEAKLAFAGLHQLLLPLLGRLDLLPGPQRQALETAFGIAEGDAPDLFLIGLATLG